MNMDTLRHVFDVLSYEPSLLDHITLTALHLVITLATKLKNDILAAQPPDHDPLTPPPALPDHIAVFLATVVDMNINLVPVLWHAIAGTVWQRASELDMPQEQHAWDQARADEISGDTLWPPNEYCTNTNCINFHKSLIRERDGRRRVTLYTLGGARSTFSVHLVCSACRTTYYPNYAVQQGVRSYYAPSLTVIQAAEHHYVDRPLADLFISMMLMSWTSATNVAKIYNHTFTPSHSPPLPRLNKHHVFDIFIIMSLLDDCGRQGLRLHVPHTGDQKDRFLAAMTLRNERMRIYGQPEAAHFCSKCMRTFVDADGALRTIHALVGDAVCIGHARCSADGCPIPLYSHADRFCPSHHYLNYCCAVTTCRAPTTDHRKTCGIPAHRQLEVQHQQRNTAMFQLKGVLQRQAVTHLDDASAVSAVNDAVETNNGPEVPQQSSTFIDDTDCPAKNEQGPYMKAILGRTRTHAEFTFNRPCGIIISRYTCVKAESLSSVHCALRELDAIGLLPDVLFYDNGCRLHRYLAKHDPSLLTKITLPVDVFHWTVKHKKNDAECSLFCNPMQFPELRTEDGWYFNSSIAEQNNVWLGAYHSIVREMSFTKYNFFLDELILRKNRLTLASLTNYAPGYLPDTE